MGGMNWGGAAEGAGQGAMVGSAGGPWGTGIGAVLGGLLGAIKKKKDPATASAETGAEDSGGFSMDTIMKAISGLTGGGGQEEAAADENVLGSNNAAMPYMPVTLPTFPQRNIVEALSSALAKRRGF